MKNFGAKLKTFIKTNYKLLIFIAIFFFLNCIFFSIACFKNDIPIFSKKSIVIMAFITFITIALCVFVFFARKKHLPIEKIFLVIGSTIGLIYLFAIPIGRVPDEPAHIWRAYSIAQGNLLTETQDNLSGNYLPENIANFSNTYTKKAYTSIGEQLLNPVSEEQTFVKTIGSNPVDYTPQLVGLVTGRVLHLPMLIMFYLARLCGLAFCITVIYFCLKYIPILKKFLFLLSCLPLTMQTFIGISYDGVIFCSAISIITFIIYTIYKNDFKFRLPHYFMATILSIALIAVKPVYFPICLLLYFIPSRCFKNKKQKILTISSILALTIGAFFIWSLLSFVTEPGNGADTAGQISYIMSNPLRYIAILIHNIFDMPFMYITNFSSLEWLDVQINDFYILGIFIIFIILCMEESLSSGKIKLSKAFCWATFILSIISTVLIFTALYIQWTQVGSHTILGVQTRYVFPVLISIPILCLAIFSNRRLTSTKKEIIPLTYLCIFVVLLSANALTTIMCAHI